MVVTSDFGSESPGSSPGSPAIDLILDYASV